jgi:hypothetical protein
MESTGPVAPLHRNGGNVVAPADPFKSATAARMTALGSMPQHEFLRPAVGRPRFELSNLGCGQAGSSGSALRNA